MKKTTKMIALVFALTMGISSFAGCFSGGGTVIGGTSVPEQIIDKNKTQIVMSVFNGGYGYEWAIRHAQEWNKTNEKYEVIVSPNKDEWYTFQANLQAGTCQYDIMQNTPNQAAYANGYLENLSDVLTMKADGDEETLADKANDVNTWKASLSYNNEVFAIPFMESVSGFVYDHEIFKEKLFLIGQDGKLITNSTQELSVGRDGVAGTYDDGQPVNMTQYNLMVNAIKSSGLYTYLWTYKFSYYTEPLFWQLFYDYAGRDNVDNIFRGLNGTYTNPKTGATTQISKDNGYEVYQMEGYYQSLKFIGDYLADPTYYHPSAAKYSTSHTDAQKVFVYGNAFDGSTSDKQVAFLYEGNWWENEARANFNSLAGRGYTDYKFGVRDYRMMLTPALDEYSANGQIPLVTFDSLNISVKKQNDANKLAAIKDFLAYLYSDDVLNDISVSCGALIPFETNMTEEHFSKMSKFASNMQQLYRDKNTYVVNLKYPRVQLSGTRGFVVSANTSGSTTTLYPVTFFQRGAGITTICDALTAYNNTYTYAKTNWETIKG